MKITHINPPGLEGIQVSPVPVAAFFRERLADMHPAYFAFVMATGIVAIGGKLLNLDELAWALARINWVAYPALCFLLLLRVFLFPKKVWADCNSHQRSTGFFTLVAATAVFGVQAMLLHDNAALAQGLWWLTLALWVVMTYGIFALLITQAKKPTLAEGINGGWLVAIVATQSVVVLGCIAGGAMLGDRELSLLMLLSFWLSGGVLYIWIISLIFYRYLFFDFSPHDLMPPYWINMGAVAISALAGALLIMNAEDSTLLQPMLPFITGITIGYWATATWWIPMLLVLGVWRHQVKNFPLAYDPLYWGLVFPLGMYAVCTFRLGNILGTAYLVSAAYVFISIAALAWTLTFLGLTRRIVFSLALAFHQARYAPSGATSEIFEPQPEELTPHEYISNPSRT